MQKLIFSFLAFVLLTGCQNSNVSSGGARDDTPALSPNSPATSRLPSPGNQQRTAIQQSQTMNVPQ